MSENKLNLLSEFPPSATEAWMQVVTNDLKGKDFEKTLVKRTEEGIPVKPFHRQEDLPSTAALLSDARRGWDKADNRWKVRQVIDNRRSFDQARQSVQAAVRGGVDELEIDGVPDTPSSLKQLLEGVDLASIGLVMDCCKAMSLVDAAFPGQPIRFGLSNDPLLKFLRTGQCPWKERIGERLAWAKTRPGTVTSVTVEAQQYLLAGSSASKQLAYALAELAQMSDAMSSPADFGYVEVRLGVGPSYLVEIAKIRAFRVLLDRLLGAFGVEGVRPLIHAVTTDANLTVYDPHVNMLRVTTEAMSAVLAGCDSLTVSPYDVRFQSPSEFSLRIARNVQHLLREESYLDKVVDPVGGSYTVESLTESLAHEAWRQFQAIEAEGGLLAAFHSGTIPNQIAADREAKRKAVTSRRTSLVGTSAYPSLKERHLAEDRPLPPIESNPQDPLNPFFLGEPFENLRLGVEVHVSRGGKEPVVALVQSGDLTMRKARAGFASAFYGCGGYGVHELPATDDMQEAARLAAECQADLVVLCSSDPEYVQLAKPLKDEMTDAGLKAKLVVAGQPADSIEQLKADGVDDFVHLRLNVVDTLAALNSELGVPTYQEACK